MTRIEDAVSRQVSADEMTAASKPASTRPCPHSGSTATVRDGNKASPVVKGKTAAPITPMTEIQMLNGISSVPQATAARRNVTAVRAQRNLEKMSGPVANRIKVTRAMDR